MQNEFDQLDKIVATIDYKSLFQLKNNAVFSLALHQILINKNRESPGSLNEKELCLFLSMHIENSGQSCSILGHLQEWFPEYQQQTVEALRYIGATKSSNLIQRAVVLLPKDNSRFFDQASV